MSASASVTTATHRLGMPGGSPASASRCTQKTFFGQYTGRPARQPSRQTSTVPACGPSKRAPVRRGRPRRLRRNRHRPRRRSGRAGTCSTGTPTTSGVRHRLLPARHSSPKKAKPLVRLTERETAAYCVLRGIDYLVDECPMAVGNKHLAYKAALNDIERDSPGAKYDFYFRFLDQAASRFETTLDTDTDQILLAPCTRAASRRTTRSAPSAPRPSATPRRSRLFDGRHPRRAPHPEGGQPMSRSGPLIAGEPVLLIDRKKRRYLIDLKEGGEFHSHSGVLPHDELIGVGRGRPTSLQSGDGCVHRHPTDHHRLCLPKMPRGAQVVYPKDIGPIIIQADIFPGAVFESGLGSGALSTGMLRAEPTSSGMNSATTSSSTPATPSGGSSGQRLLSAIEPKFGTCIKASRKPNWTGSCLIFLEPWQVVPHAERHCVEVDPLGVHAEQSGVPAPRSARGKPFPHGRNGGGTPSGLVRERDGGSSRPPDGRAHRVLDPRPPTGRARLRVVCCWPS